MPGLLKILRKDEPEMINQLLREYNRLEGKSDDDITLNDLLASEFKDANEDDFNSLSSVVEAYPSAEPILEGMKTVLNDRLTNTFNTLSTRMTILEGELLDEYHTRLKAVAKNPQFVDARKYFQDAKDGKPQEPFKLDFNDAQLKNLIKEKDELTQLRAYINLEDVFDQSLDDKFVKLKYFNEKLKDANTKISHPSTSWTKFIYNAISFLTVLGAAARALWSLGTTGSAKFWKTEGEKLAERAQKEQAKLAPQSKK